jgi:hypothetical protein
MSLIKNALDYILWDVLRIRRPKCRGSIDGIRPSTVTLRTYTEGGDPFEDRIEFHLRNRPGVPSGFRMPNGTKDEDVGQVVDEAEIRRAFGVKD